MRPLHRIEAASAAGRRATLWTLREALTVALAMAAAVAGSPSLGAVGEDAWAQAGPDPNVVVIMTDDQDLASVEVMRNVQRHIARRGTTFENAFATFPLCCPSRVSFLTGQYAHNHGVTDNSGPNGGYRAFDDRNTLPVALRRDGYRTGFIGKYLNGYDQSSVSTPAELRDFPPGWDEWRTMLTGHYFGWKLNDNGRVRDYGRRAVDYQSDVFTSKALEFIRRSSRSDSPFFLTLSYKAPHIEQGYRLDKVPNPRPAPRHEGLFKGSRLPRSPAFNERDVSDKPAFVQRRARIRRGQRAHLTRLNRDRRESLLAVDEGVGQVVQELRGSGELRNTLLIFWSDNGFLLGEHRLKGKHALYEESARVPIIMRGPGIPSGRSRDQIVGNIDLAPTILEAAGAESLRVMDGRSLARLARKPMLDRDRDILLENRTAAALRTPEYMYAEHATGEVELYDMIDDPFQLESRHDDPAFVEVQARLSERLDQLRSCSGADCRRVGPADGGVRRG